jgi:hypothetical protein
MLTNNVFMCALIAAFSVAELRLRAPYRQYLISPLSSFPKLVNIRV